MSRVSKEQRVKWLLEDGLATKEDLAWSVVSLTERLIEAHIVLDANGLLEELRDEDI